MKLIHNAYDLLCKIISPPFCAYCRTLIPERSILCSECKGHLQPVVSHKLELTKNRSIIVHSLSSYKEPLKTLILKKNIHSQQASFQLGRLMARYMKLDNLPVDYFVPVPLHWTRFARRGFNQSEIIAQELAKKYRVPVCIALKRRKMTAYQSHYVGSQRIENVKGVFELIPTAQSLLQGKHVVIVDDLMTSGATLSAAAKQIISLNPASLSARVACRVV